MYYINTLANFEEEAKAKPLDYVRAAGGVGLTGMGLRSGVPRMFGVRLESHSTSNENAKKIKNNNNYLDPNFGGSGASKSVGVQQFIDNSKNSIHITGVNDKTNYKSLGVPEETMENPIFNSSVKSTQRKLYRSISGDENAKANINIKGLIGLKGKSFYVGGSDDYFNDNFTPDSDDFALKTDKPLKVSGNRLGATYDAINREGLGNLLRNSPKSRIIAGVGLSGAGLLGGYLGIKNLVDKRSGE